LDGHNREECLVIGGKTKLVIGGRKNGFLWKDRHDQPAALNFLNLTISKYLAVIFPVTIQNVMLFFIITPVHIMDLSPLLNGKIKQAQGAGAPGRNDAADECPHKHKKIT
jgi:hypothetical protein